MPDLESLNSYREKYPNQTKDFETDEQLIKAIYLTNKKHYEDEYPDFNSFKDSFGIEEEEDEDEEEQEFQRKPPDIKDEDIEKDIADIDPNTRDRLKKQKQIIENFQRTTGVAGAAIGQNLLDFGNFLVRSKFHLSEEQTKAFAYSQQKAMIDIAENIFGKETIKVVNRDGVPSLGFKDPTYKGGKAISVMAPILASVIGSQAALVKHGPKAVTKMQKWLQGTTAGIAGEQVGWDVYEERLMNMLGEYVADDGSARSDFVRYLEGDRDDSQLEARVGVLVEGMLLAGGLSAVWQTAKATAKGTYEGGIKPASKAIMNKLKSFRRSALDEKKTKFIQNLDEGTVWGKRSKVKQKKEEILHKKKEPQVHSKSFDESQVKEEEIVDLWQFAGDFGDPKLLDTIKRTVYQYTGGPIFNSRGQFTPRLFQMFKASENAKKAWATRAEHITRDLESTLASVAKSMFKGRSKKAGISRREYFDETLLKIQSYLDGTTLKLEGMAKPKVMTLKDIPKELHKHLNEVRPLQDDLSEILAQSNYVPKEVKEIITSKLGKYIRKSYDFYESKGWLPNTQTISKAEKYFAGVLNRGITKVGNKRFLYLRLPDKLGRMRRRKIPIAQNGQVVVDGKVWKLQDYIRENARGRVTKIVKSRKTADNVFNYVDKVYGVLPGTLKARKTMPKAIRDLLGETKDPRATILNSISKIANHVETDNFLEMAWKLGKGKYFHSNPTGIYSTPIEGTHLGALNGRFTTAPMARIFHQTGFTYGHWGEKTIPLFLAAKGYGQASKTVLNHITHIRNTLGGATFMLANGMNPFSKETGQAFKVLRNELDTLGKRKEGRGEFDSAYDQLYEKFTRLGIVNTSVKAGDFRALINDAADLGLERTADKGLKALPGYGVWGKKVETYAKIPQKLYIAEDDLFKISSFYKEYNTLKRAYGNKYSKETLEQRAAETVRNTIPNYDLVPQGVKQLRKLPFGNYFSFPAEMYRTSFHIVRQAGREMADPNRIIRQRGYKRAAGFMTAGMLGAEGLSTTTQMIFGVKDEEVEAIRHLLEPEYSKYTNQIYSRDKDGNLYKNNYSYIDPYDVIKAPFRIMLMDWADGTRTQEERDRTLVNSMTTIIEQVTKPFISEALLTESFRDITFGQGKTKEGQRIKGWIYSEAEPSEVPFEDTLNNFLVGIRHISETFIPGSAPQLKRLFKSFSDDPVLPSGQELSWKTEVAANLTGFRWQKVNQQYVKSALRRKLNNYKKEEKQIINNMYSGIGQGKNEKDVIRGFLQAQKQHYDNWKRLKFARDSAKTLYKETLEFKNPVDKTYAVLKEHGIDKGVLTADEAEALGENRYVPFELSEGQIEEIRQENDFDYMSKQSLFSLLNSYTQKFYSLPMIDLEREEKNEEIIEKLRVPARELIREKTRKQQFKGGEISEDYPVPNVIKDPSERIDPNTGEPYDEPLERLGFTGGGLAIDPLHRLGFTGGGLMLSIGVAPVSEKQIDSLKKVLKKRKAKRDGGRIGFAFGDGVILNRIRERLAQRDTGDNLQAVQEAEARAKDLKEGNYWDEERLIEVIKKDEGYRSKAYKPDPTEKEFTIGYGFYGAKKNDTITREDADKRLASEVDKRIRTLEGLVPESKYYNKDLQDAMFSVHWRGDIKQSDNTRKLIKKGHYNEAAVEFLRHEEYDNAVALGIPGIRPRMKRFSDELKRLHEIRGYVP